MHRVMADKNGGTRVKLSPEEETAVRADWEKNEAAMASERAKEAEEKALQAEALEAMTSGLSEKHKGALKKMMKG